MLREQHQLGRKKNKNHLHIALHSCCRTRNKANTTERGSKEQRISETNAVACTYTYLREKQKKASYQPTHNTDTHTTRTHIPPGANKKMFRYQPPQQTQTLAHSTTMDGTQKQWTARKANKRSTGRTSDTPGTKKKTENNELSQLTETPRNGLRTPARKQRPRGQPLKKKNEQKRKTTQQELLRSESARRGQRNQQNKRQPARVQGHFRPHALKPQHGGRTRATKRAASTTTHTHTHDTHDTHVAHTSTRHTHNTRHPRSTHGTHEHKNRRTPPRRRPTTTERNRGRKSEAKPHRTCETVTPILQRHRGAIWMCFPSLDGRCCTTSTFFSAQNTAPDLLSFFPGADRHATDQR